MELYQTVLPVPKDWQELQRMATDFFKKEYPSCVVQDYGRQGQEQFGVDTYIYSSDSHIGVQCKCVTKFTVGDLKEEVNKLKRFPFRGKLSRYVVIVTIPSDKELTNAASHLTIDESLNIEVRFWDEFSEDVASIEDLANKYFKFAYKVNVEVGAGAAHVTLLGGFSQFEFVVTKMSVFKKYEKQRNLVLVTSLQAGKKATLFNLSSGYWTNFDGVIGAGAIDAYMTWRWISQFSSFEELLSESKGRPEIVISEVERRKFVASLERSEDD
jgi:hypothetical protein